MLKQNKSYLGTVAHDTIQPIPKHKNSSQVINLHKSSQLGSHFVCYFHDVKKKVIYYFDSYGVMPSDTIQDMLRKTGKTIEYNTSQIQSNTSNRCGFYCYAFIQHMSKGKSFLDFIQQFKHKAKNNDKTLIEILT